MNNRSVIVKNVVQLSTTIVKNNTLVFPLRVTFSPETSRIVIEEEACRDESMSYAERCPSTLELIEGNIYNNDSIRKLY